MDAAISQRENVSRINGRLAMATKTATTMIAVTMMRRVDVSLIRVREKIANAAAVQRQHRQHEGWAEDTADADERRDGKGDASGSSDTLNQKASREICSGGKSADCGEVKEEAVIVGHARKIADSAEDNKVCDE